MVSLKERFDINDLAIFTRMGFTEWSNLEWWLDCHLWDSLIGPVHVACMASNLALIFWKLPIIGPLRLCSWSIRTCVGHLKYHLEEEHVTLCAWLTTILRELGCISWFTKMKTSTSFIFLVRESSLVRLFLFKRTFGLVLIL